MKIYFDCMPCFICQALEAARLVTDDEIVHEQVVRYVLKLAADLDMSQPPPAIGQQIHHLIRKLVGNEDPYRESKKRFNHLALEICRDLEDTIASSEDPLETAIRLAIAGNIIDLGVKTSIAESDIAKIITDCLTADFDKSAIEQFKNAVESAKSILYLTDNAGEIVFDRFLIEQLPPDKVTVVVRGKPVINDATMEDAEFAGLTELVEVIDNGSDAPGTILELCSEEFKRRFEQFDLIISKGQGNYETLSDKQKDIFFILKAKCPMIARNLGCEVGEMIFKRSNHTTIFQKG
ncbi:MAG: DUF89 family protein [Sedimentisphaerales bacterium]|nr:DUF89 family protein [Sedimentisphaerales bacterium]